MATRRSAENNNRNLRKLEELEAALKLVLDLEDFYSASASTSSLLSANETNLGQDVDPFANPVELLLSDNMPSAVKSLLSSSVATTKRTGSGIDAAPGRVNPSCDRGNNISRPATTVEQSQPQERERRKSEARAKWVELDERLARMSSLSSSSSSTVSKQEWAPIQRLLTDVTAGRADKWVRTASVQEKEAQRKAFVEAQQDDLELQKQQQQQSSNSSTHSSVVMSRSVVPHDVVLGSASSSVGRSILHALLTSSG